MKKSSVNFLYWRAIVAQVWGVLKARTRFFLRKRFRI